MSIDKTVVNKVARLAKLDIGFEGEEKFTAIENDLNRIVGMVSLIAKANTQNISPMAHPFDIAQRLRPDVITEGNETAQVMPLAPLEEENIFLVPKVIE